MTTPQAHVTTTTTTTGPAAEDAAASGNPLLVGGRYDATDRTLDTGDVGAIALDAAGRIQVAGPSANAPVAAMPGASEVKTLVTDVAATSATVATLVAGVSGKKLRVISIQCVSDGLSTDPGRVSFFFGPGVGYTTTRTKAIGEGSPGTTGRFTIGPFPDGAGPVDVGTGEAMKVITETETETQMRYTVHYREE